MNPKTIRNAILAALPLWIFIALLVYFVRW